MRQHANEISLSPTLRLLLRDCGISQRRIDSSVPATRLYHDLGIYGDIAEACMETLSTRHSVDLSGFTFEEYFPSEFVGNSRAQKALNWLLPMLGNWRRRSGQYRPLTLAMIENAIAAGRWIEAD